LKLAAAPDWGNSNRGMRVSRPEATPWPFQRQRRIANVAIFAALAIANMHGVAVVNRRLSDTSGQTFN